jgi:L-fuculose-phosphate aldolase
MLLHALRTEVAATARRLVLSRLVTGTAGNVSAREPETGHVAITPTGLDYETMTAADIVVVDREGQPVDGRWLPSSELPMHLEVYRRLPERHAVVHTHSLFATVFAASGREIKGIHYEITIGGGTSVRVAPYATYGTPELARNAVETMGQQSVVLLQNHGLLAVGPTLARAYAIAEKIEFIAELYYHALQLGSPIILPDDELLRVLEKSRSYGQPAQLQAAPTAAVEERTDQHERSRAARRRQQATPG